FGWYPIAWARTSKEIRFSPSFSYSRGRSSPVTETVVPVTSSPVSCSASAYRPHTLTEYQVLLPVSAKEFWSGSHRRSLSATDRFSTAAPDWVNLISESRPRLPLMLIVLLMRFPFRRRPGVGSRRVQRGGRNALVW